MYPSTVSVSSVYLSQCVFSRMLPSYYFSISTFYFYFFQGLDYFMIFYLLHIYFSCLCCFNKQAQMVDGDNRDVMDLLEVC